MKNKSFASKVFNLKAWQINLIKFDKIMKLVLHLFTSLQIHLTWFTVHVCLFSCSHILHMVNVLQWSRVRQIQPYQYRVTQLPIPYELFASYHCLDHTYIEIKNHFLPIPIPVVSANINWYHTDINQFTDILNIFNRYQYHYNLNVQTNNDTYIDDIYLHTDNDISVSVSV